MVTALRVAQEFVDGYYHQFPEEGYEIGDPGTPKDRLGDHSGEAENELGARFDIKCFHDVFLGGGSVRLPMLPESVARWVREQSR